MHKAGFATWTLKFYGSLLAVCVGIQFIGKEKGDDFNAIKYFEKYFLDVSCYMLSCLCVTIDGALFLYSTGQSWGKWKDNRCVSGQLLVDGDMYRREKELELKGTSIYFSGLYLVTHRGNHVRLVCQC